MSDARCEMSDGSPIKTIILFLVAFQFLCFNSPINAQSSGCNIASIKAVTEPVCETATTYYVEIEIKHGDIIPDEGTVTIEANDAVFQFPIIPDNNNNQNLPLELLAEGSSDLVDITAYYSVDPDCRILARDLFESIAGCGIIGDFVWLDTNENGIQDFNEEGIQGITVKLIMAECKDVEMEQQITNANGSFLFENLCEGEYRIEVILPNNNQGYEFTTPQVGTDPAIDSDIFENGLSNFIFLSAGEQLTSIDIGLTECPSFDGLVCNNTLNITLGDNCEREITPDLIIESEIPCDSDLDLRLFDDTGFIGTTITEDQVGKTVIAIVEDRVTGLTCSTDLFVEDKTGPQIECIAEVETGLRPDTVQFISGSLNVNDQFFEANRLTCWDNLNASNNNFFDTLFFEVKENDVYSLTLFTDWGDGAAAIYKGQFQLIQPCLNIISAKTQVGTSIPPIDLYNEFGDDLSNWVTPEMNPILEIALPLRKGKVYQLVTSSATANETGNYTWAITSNKFGRFLRQPPLEEGFGPLQFDIVCTNFDSIFGNIESLELLPYPVLSDNCSDEDEIDLRAFDQIKRKSFCGPNIIQRTFTAIDPSGNETQCIQDITSKNPGPQDIILPPEAVFLHCDENFTLDANGNPSVEAVGFPFVWTLYGVQAVNESYCNVSAGYEDEIRIENCEGSYTIFRKWALVDFCNPFNRMNFEQIIKVIDEDAPMLDLSTISNGNQDYPDTLIFSTGPFDCTAAMEVPLPNITDNCSSGTELLIEVISEVEVDVLDPGSGVPIGTRIDTQIIATVPPGETPVVFNIPMGCHRFRYTAMDDCGNKGIAEYPFCVEDQVAPIAICEDNLTISVGGQGVARLFAETVDKGSYDACELENLTIRRAFPRKEDCSLRDTIAYGVFGPFVDFGCCDIGDTIQIELLVTDKAGNANSCFLAVMIEDKIKPICVAPKAATISCNDLPANFDPTDTDQLANLFGEPEASADNCIVERYEELEPVVTLDDCQIGEIQRRFRVYDRADNVSTNICTQLVTIEAEFNYEIKFPADLRVNCEVPDPDSAFIESLGCDLMGVQIKDERFSGGSDDCYKIFRTYNIINWCEYDSESDPVLIRRDEDCDGISGDEAVWVLRRPNQTFIDRDNDETNQVPRIATKVQTCDGETNPEGYWRTVTSNGFWTYLQIISVFDDTPPSIVYNEPEAFCSFNNDECTGQVDISFQLEELCTTDDLDIEVLFDFGRDSIPDQDFTFNLSGSYPNYQLSGSFLIGQHAFEVKVEDGCGNTGIFRLPFEVTDCIAPAPICNDRIIAVLSALPEDTDIDGDGETDRASATVWARDFIASVTNDCTGAFLFSINRVGETPNPLQDSLIFTCRDSVAIVPVEIHAWDAFGNNGFCISNVELQDNGFGLCETLNGSIAGFIEREDGTEIPSVEVLLDNETEIISTFTGNKGSYEFLELKEGLNYSITPKLNEDHANGVSTLDLITISRHILGIESLDSPYKMIAADVNASNTITTLDLITMRKLILRIERVFTNNESWRFVRSDYEFPVPDNPWIEVFPESDIIEALAGAAKNINFIGIKVGDVNNSANVSQLSPPIEVRNQNDPLILKAKQQSLNSISLTASDLEKFEGFQFSLDYSGLGLQEISYDLLQPSNIAIHGDQNIITVSWHQPEHQLDGNQVLMTLHFKSTSSINFEDHLVIHSRLTASEAYHKKKIHAINLAFPIDDNHREFSLGQNFPNPVINYTQIPIFLPDDAEVQLTMFDLNGRIILNQVETFSKGKNLFKINCQNMTPGVFTYQIETPFGVKVKQLIVLNQ